MTHFEYVSVAIALLSALAAGRLLGGFSPALDRSKRYWVHFGWITALLLVCVVQWWGLWRMREVSWTPIRFLLVLSMPALIYVQAAVLVGEDPGRVGSFREHYSACRVRFFSVTLVSAAVTAFSPWVFGNVPWLDLAPVHTIAAMLGAISLVGLRFTGDAVHGTLVVLAVLIAASSFVIAPPA